MAAVGREHILESSPSAERAAYQRFHARRHRMLIDLLAAHVPNPVARALDIGAGGDSGGVDEALRDRFAQHLYSLDLGEDVALARGKGITSHECNIDTDEFPFSDGYFGLIVFASVIEHLYNPHWALREIRRVLRPGGLLLVEAPNAVAFGRRVRMLAGSNPFASFNRYNAIENKAFMAHCSVFYTPSEVEAAAGQDFTLVDRRYAMHDPPAGLPKRMARAVLARVVPQGSDCFALLLRREG